MLLLLLLLLLLVVVVRTHMFNGSAEASALQRENKFSEKRSRQTLPATLSFCRRLLRQQESFLLL